MYMKDVIGNSISDDAEFDDLDDFDYVDQFISKDEEGSDSSYMEDEYDDLDDLYVEDNEETEDELEEDSEGEDYSDEDMEDMDEELEARFICDDCGHKWVDFISETDEENDMFDINCPLCGSQNVTMER